MFRYCHDDKLLQPPCSKPSLSTRCRHSLTGPDTANGGGHGKSCWNEGIEFTRQPLNYIIWQDRGNDGIILFSVRDSEQVRGVQRTPYLTRRCDGGFGKGVWKWKRGRISQ